MGKITSRFLSAILAMTICSSSLMAMAYAENSVAENVDGNGAQNDEIVLKTVFDAPSKDWESECTQLGNGFLGAMIYGGYAVDQIQINENSIWDGGPTTQTGYAGGNNFGTEEQNYSNLSKLRDYLQVTMKDFTDNKSSYIDASGKVVSNDYPDLSSEAQGWLDSLKGPKTHFGHYYPMGDIYTSDYLTPEIKKANNSTITSSETENTTVANLVDGDASTDWTSENTNMPVSVSIEYDEPVTFKAYKITSSSVRETEGNTPSAWKLYASENGTDYKVIDTRTNIKFDSIGSSKIFELNSEVTYKYFKLEINRTRKNGSVAKIGDFSFMSQEETEAETAEYSDYKRVLDMNNAIASVTYKKNDVKYDREYFISYPNNFMAMKLTADKDNALDKYIYLDSILNPNVTAEIKDNIGIVTMQIEVGTQEKKEKVACQLRIVADDGAKLSYDSSNAKYIHVEDADEIKVYMTAGTNYVECMDDTFNYLSDENPLDKVSDRLDLVEKQDYNTQKTTHTEDYRNLFTRVNLSLNDAEFPEYMTTKELVQGYKAGTNTDSENRYLEMLYYQMGRYLMIAGSREGSLPLNLQGIWNQATNPPWRCGYTTNINAEMNYWLAETTNLSECHEPMTTFIKAQVERGRKTAQNYHYNVNEYKKTGEFKPVRGWTCYHNLNIWGNTGPDKSSCFYFPTAAAWLCQDIWEHYAFTLDKEFLKDNYYILKEASLFWVDNLVTDERDGTLVSSPGHSPEHGGISMGTTGDQTIIWELFNNTLKAAETLQIDDSETAEIKNAMSKLSLPKIGLAGQFQEWKDEVTLDISGHNGYKHVTHMFALYPGSFVVPGRSEQDDKYADALRESLNVRGDGGTGWGKAWKIGLWARARDGERAGRMVSSILNGSTLFNLFDTHTPFQIDGNFGATAGMTEMLLQSQGNSVELLPAVPSMWKQGSVNGLRARGGITVDINWANNSLTNAEVTSDVDNDNLSVSYPNIADMVLYDSQNNVVEFTSEDKDTITFATKKDEKYTIVSQQNDLAVQSATAYKSENKITKVELNFNDTVPKSISAYYAVYDNNKKLVGVNKAIGNDISDKITLTAPDNDNSNVQKIYIWNNNMKPISKAIDVNALPFKYEDGGQTTPPPSSDYLIDEDFNNIRGNWGFAGKDRTFVSGQVLKFEGGGAGEIDIKTMDKEVADSKMLDIEFDWRSDTDLSSSGRTAVFELTDKSNKPFFAMYGNTKSSEGIKYTTSKSAYGDDDLEYTAFPVYQGKNSDWYHISLSVNFANKEITSATVKKGDMTILTLNNEPIEAVDFAYMRMIDLVSVSGMSIDNVKIRKSNIVASSDTTLKSGFVKGKAVTLKSSAVAPDDITDFANTRVTKDAAVNPYKLTEFTPNYGGANVKVVKYSSDVTDYSDFDTAEAYNDENIINGDKFIIRVTAENGDIAYYGVVAEVSDGSDEAYLDTFEIYNGTENLIKDFEFNQDLEPGGDYGTANLVKTIETVTLKYTTSDERLTKGEDTGLGGVKVTVNDNESAYNKATGNISLVNGENIIKVAVTSYDGTMNGQYIFTVNRTDFNYIERFDGKDVPELWNNGSYKPVIEDDGGNVLAFVTDKNNAYRGTRGYILDNNNAAKGTAKVEFDYKISGTGNYKKNTRNIAYLVGGDTLPTKDNNAELTSGRILEIATEFKTSNTESITTINGENLVDDDSLNGLDWVHITAELDILNQKATVKVTDKRNADKVYFDKEVNFMDTTSDFRGFFILRGAGPNNNAETNVKQKLDNICLQSEK